jgi:hypothetical protein
MSDDEEIAPEPKRASQPKKRGPKPKKTKTKRGRKPGKKPATANEHVSNGQVAGEQVPGKQVAQSVAQPLPENPAFIQKQYRGNLRSMTKALRKQ